MIRRILAKIGREFHQLRRSVFPTEHERTLARWWADDGDNTLRFNYNLDRDSLVLDLGGYRGQWTSDLFARYCCRIIVFEPVTVYAEEIRRRFIKNEKIQILQFGLGASSRKEAMSLCAEGSSNFLQAGRSEQIDIVDAAAWMPASKLGIVSLMKINIEGGEYELMERLIDTGLIKSIENIQIQFHDMVPGAAARMARIQDRLRDTHTPTYQYKFVWESWTIKPVPTAR